ncbi:hypothetical protein JQ629_09675 [Bradyrhizobium sp. AUGA SZCCT0222]|uniref:hypothetical protein n=1 Tax=Bradyrhizobium sp. AUGA SZCCT0222 TaxID=2807668 RepID=UPI001BADEB17|nr:hypothetical protein [Bradyrhizobium sp. AUGA SZCCT0222]MBR1267773.1 hypothetical protein [Bradyrhizobium sp. AUGA SZCCT0222]
MERVVAGCVLTAESPHLMLAGDAVLIAPVSRQVLCWVFYRKTDDIGGQRELPCSFRLERERDQLIQRIGQLHAQHGQGYDHQKGAEMHEG